MTTATGRRTRTYCLTHRLWHGNDCGRDITALVEIRPGDDRRNDRIIVHRSDHGLLCIPYVVDLFAAVMRHR